jgi:hypothetical protein
MKIRLMYLGKRQFKWQRPYLGMRKDLYTLSYRPYRKYLAYYVYFWHFALTIKLTTKI